MKISIIIMLLILQSCGGGSTTGNPISTTNVAVSMQDKQPFAWLKYINEAFISSAYAAVSNTKFCFKRLRFKPDSITAGSNFDLILGEVTINPSGVSLLTVTIPSGTYTRVEFDLEKECDGVAGKPSVIFTNGTGTFSTIETMTIKFDGVYVAGADGSLTLDIDSLFDAMDLITANNQIKTALEAAPGGF